MGGEMKKEYLTKIRSRYNKGEKGEKTAILDEFCAVCGYQRKYAIRLLSRTLRRPRKKPGRKPRYGPETVAPLKRIWFTADQVCSKKLVAAIPLWLPYYDAEYGPLDPEIRQNLLDLSPASIDRLLGPTRAKQTTKGLSATKPGTLLRNQIPIRTGNWDITKPGFLEADTVAHCGNSIDGNFVWSLTFTDIYSGWTEIRAIWNKGAHGVITELTDVESRLAFPLLGFDCDNGSEFLNHHLLRYLTERRQPVTFTRGRPYHSNDNAHVEQKQWTHVRQLLGYERFSNADLVEPINNLYTKEWSLFQNYFCPTLKLESKERINSKYRRRYSKPQTPYQRLLDSPDVTPEAKDYLRMTYQTLNPFRLKRAIERKLKIVFNIHNGGRL